MKDLNIWRCKYGKTIRHLNRNKTSIWGSFQSSMLSVWTIYGGHTRELPHCQNPQWRLTTSDFSKREIVVFIIYWISKEKRSWFNQCICFSSSCVPYVVRFIGLSIINCVVYLFFFVLCTLCCQFLSFLRLGYPMLPDSLDCPFLIDPWVLSDFHLNIMIYII